MVSSMAPMGQFAGSGPRTGKPSPQQMIEDRGRIIMHSVRHPWKTQVDPRRRSLPERAGEDGYDDDDYEDNIPTILFPRSTAQQRFRQAAIVGAPRDGAGEVPAFETAFEAINVMSWR